MARPGLRALAAGIALLGLVCAQPGASGKAECAVSAAPKASLAPLRFLRVRAVVEPDPRTGRIELALFGPAGYVTSTLLWERGWTEPARTYTVEWKNVSAEAGDFEVVLQAGRTDGSVCRAVDPFVVG